MSDTIEISGKKFYQKHSRRLVRALTQELYKDVYEVLREYICNGVDGNANEVNITCRPPYNTMIIKDDGEGIDEVTWKYMLENFAISIKKDDPDTIGMHGLGIYSGGLICGIIVLKTKTINDKKIRVVNFPIGEWLADDKEGEIAVETLQESLYFFESTEDITDLTPESFTIIQLKKLNPIIKETLENKKNYKSFYEKATKSWPLSFSPVFKSTNPVVYRQIKQFYDDHKLLGSRGQFQVKVFLNGNQLYKWVPNDKGVPLKFYDIESCPVEIDGNKTVWIWWVLNRSDKFLDKYPNLKKWMSCVNKGQNEFTDEDGTKIEVKDEFSITYNKKILKLDYSTIENYVKYAEPARKTSGLFLRLKNVMIYKPKDVWSEIHGGKNTRRWAHCWGEIFVVDEDIYPEMSRADLRGKNIAEFKKEISKVLASDLVYGKINKIHHKGSKKKRNYRLKFIDEEIKKMFYGTEEEQITTTAEVEAAGKEAIATTEAEAEAAGKEAIATTEAEAEAAGKEAIASTEAEAEAAGKEAVTTAENDTESKEFPETDDELMYLLNYNDEDNIDLIKLKGQIITLIKEIYSINDELVVELYEKIKSSMDQHLT